MRAALIALAAILAAVPAPADAHRLGLLTAARKARSEALFISGQVHQRSRVSVRYCDRRTRHVVDCRVRYRFVKDGELTGERCYQTIRVRFTSESSRRLEVSFPPASVRC
jgi:hypothetical protein